MRRQQMILPGLARLGLLQKEEGGQEGVGQGERGAKGDRGGAVTGGQQGQMVPT